MALFVRGMGVLLVVAAHGASRMRPRSDANSLMQERISWRIRLRKDNPCDGEATQEMNRLGEMLLGDPYHRLMCKEYMKISHSNNTKKVSPTNTSSVKAEKLIKERNLANLHDTSFTQHKEAVIITNVFNHFDSSNDNKIDRKEFDAILAYLGEEWDNEKTNRVMGELDRITIDQLLQPIEFMFWFTSKNINKPKDLLKTMEKITAKSNGKEKDPPPLDKEPDTDTIELQSSDIPEDPADVKKVFGKFTQFEDALRILFLFRTFDTNYDFTVSKPELTVMLGFLEPEHWTASEVTSLMAALDLLTKNQSIELNEWWFMFTPTFRNFWEPAIHAAAKGHKN